MFAEPRFFQDERGAWARIDTALEAAPGGGEFRPRRAEREAARVARRSDRAAVRIGSRAGQVWLRHVGAAAVEGRVEGEAVRYPGAMGRGRDLLVAVTGSGFEDSVVVPDAAAGGSWRAELSLPRGVSVREAASGVELVEGDGAVVASYGDGVAFDSSGSDGAPPSHSPVRVRLVSQRRGSALLEVSADLGWLADPARVFPVTVDPVYRTKTLQSYGPGNTCGAPGQTGAYEYCDTHASQPEPTTSQYQAHWLALGSDGASRANYLFLKFPTEGLQGSGYRVVDAQVRMYAFAGQAKSYYVYGNSFSPRTDTTWNAYRPSATSYYNSWSLPAQAGWVDLPLTAAAQAWFNGTANHGVQVRAASSADYATFRQFTSMEHTNGAYKPSLRITYENRRPTTTRIGPASGTFTCSPPVLSARYDDSAEDGRVDFSVTDPAGNTPVPVGRSARIGQTVSFQTPSGPSGQYSWRTRGWDGSDYSAPEWSDSWSYFLNAVPAVPALAPNPNGQRRSIGQGQPVLTASTSDVDGNLDHIHFLVYGPNGYRHSQDVLAGNGQAVSSTPPPGPSGQYTVYTRAYDRCGASSDVTPSTYHINIRPTSTAVSPAADALVCSATPDLSARYSDANGGSGRVDFSVWGPSGYVVYGERPAGNGATVSFRMPAMPPGAFWWHTRAWDGVDSSDPEWGPFRNVYVNGPPSRPTVDAPAGGTRRLAGEGHPTLSASSSDGDNNLRDLVFEAFGPNGWYEQTNPGLAAGNNQQRSWRATGTAGGAYTWYVGAYDQCTAHSGYVSGGYRVNRRPAVPAQQSPGDGVVVAVGGAPQLAATYSDPDGERGMVDFRVERLGAAGAWEEVRWSAAGPNTSGQVARYTPPVAEAGRPDLTPGRYRWSVRAWDGSDFAGRGDHSAADGGYSATREFRVTTPPDTPTRVAPADGARTSGGPTLTVRYSDPDADPGNVDFFVRDADGNKPACVPADPVVMDNGGQRYASGAHVSYRPSCLQPGAYTWFTRAWDGLASETSPSWSFRVNAPPGIPAGPAPGTTDPANPEMVCLRRPPLSATYTDPDGDSGRIYFRVYRYDAATGTYQSTAHNGHGELNPTPAGTVVTFVPAADLADGAHAWRAYANDGVDSSADTAYRYFTVECAAPGQPQRVEATKGDTEATVTWQPPPVGLLPVTGYQVSTYVASNRTPVGDPVNLPDTERSHRTTGLANGTGYYFEVSARNTIGQGQPARSNTVTPDGRPLAPTGVSAAAGDTAATVTWTAANSNGSTLTGNRVEVTRDSDGARMAALDEAVAGSATSATVDGLANGTEYSFKVVARNVNGDGPASAASNTVRPHAPPQVPDLLSPEEGAAVVVATLTAAYQDPEGDIGRIDFEVYQGPGGPGAAPPVASGSDDRVPSGDPASYTPVPPLLPGVYSWRARASDGDWESDWSPSRSFAVAGTPSAPRQVQAAEGDTRATVRWTASDGLLVDGYRVETYKAADDSRQPQEASTDAAGREAAIEGLANGTEYYFKVYAHNPVGDSLPGKSNRVTPAGPPLAPPGVAAVGGNQSARVSWGAADGNGRQVDRYRVETYLANGQPHPGRAETDGAARETTIPGLTNGDEYYFVVSAHTPPSGGNPNGWGVPSANSNVVRPNAPPDVPELRAPDEGQIVARRPAPVLRASYFDFDGDPGELRFELWLGATLIADRAVDAAGGERPQELSWQPTAYLARGATYTWRVTAHDGYDSSAGSASRAFRVNQLPANAQPRLPGDGARVAGATPPELSARYSDPDGHVGTITFRLLSMSDQLIEERVVAATASSQTLYWTPTSTLTRGTSYKWTARAHDGLESSTTSEPRTFRVNGAPEPPAPSEPADGAQTGGTPTLGASYNDADGDAGSVEFQVFDANGAEVAGSPFRSGQVAPGANARVTLSSGLANGAYSWRARADDGLDTSAWGAVRNFTVVNNRPPDRLRDPNPGDRASLTRGPDFLSVTYTDPDGNPGRVEFKLYPDAAGQGDEPLLTKVDTDVGSGGSAQVGPVPVLYDGAYRWTAQATDSAGTVSDVATWHFTVRSDYSSLGFSGWAAWAASVNTGLGSYNTTATDMTVATAGPELTVVRTYNSGDRADNHPGGWGAFGPGWSFNYDMTFDVDDFGNVAVIYPDGRREVHARQRDGSYKPPAGYYSTLTKLSTGVYDLTTKDRTVYAFRTVGGDERLASIRDANGRTLVLRYDVATGKLATVGTLLTNTQDALGRTLSFTWAGNRIRSVKSDHVGAHGRRLEWTYHYDARDLLTRVCQPWSVDGQQACTTYGYTPDANKLLERITRPGGNTEALIEYHPQGLRVAAVTDGEQNRTAFAYPKPFVTEVTDPRGTADPSRQAEFATAHQYDEQYRLIKETNPEDATTSYSYDPVSGARQEIIDDLGQKAAIRYDARGNPVRVTNPAGEATYNIYFAPDDPRGDLVSEVRDPRTAPAPDPSQPPTDPAYLTTYDYDTRRNRTRQLSPPVLVDGGNQPVRLETKWVYSQGTEEAFDGGTVPPGLLVEEIDPREQRTRYVYDRFGDLREMVDRAGLTTRYSYDELGRKLTETVVDTLAQLEPTTTYHYDEVGHPDTVTEPAVLNRVSGVIHQLRTTNSYDLNGNLRFETRADAAGGDPARVTEYRYDGADRQRQVIDPLGGTLTREFDRAGNVTRVIDQEGRATRTDYDALNRAVLVVAEAFHDDPLNPTNPRDINLTATTYDDIGRRATETDAEGRTRRWTYDGADRVETVTLEYFENRNQTSRHVELESYEYDQAGNLTAERRGSGLQVVRHDYDAANRETRMVLDPADDDPAEELDRVTDYGYDGTGNQVSRVLYRPDEMRLERVTTEWHPAGWPTAETVHNDSQRLRREMGYDQRGNLVAATDPRGTGSDEQSRARYTTTYQHDEYDRVTATLGPPVSVEPGGGALARQERPTGSGGFDTFGNATHAVDSRGQRTTNAYDALDRLARTDHPEYTRPGDGGTLAAFETFSYDRVGNLRSQVSRRGEVTEFVYDNLNRVFEQRDPQLGGQERGAVRSGYDDAGNRVFERDQEGAVTRWEYDDLDRVRRQTAEVRPVAGAGGLAATTTFDYDDLGRLTYQQDPAAYPSGPASGETSHEYNAAGERTKTTHPLTAEQAAEGRPAAVTAFSYDIAGRLLVEAQPLERRTEHEYDLAGRELSTSSFQGDVLLARTGYGYDAAGNQTSRTAPRGFAEGPRERFTATYAYDAANRLAAVEVPADATTTLVTGYGYDAAGNLTRVTDGNGHTTVYEWQAWGLLEDVVEPATSQHPDPWERTWTTGYDLGGLPVEERLPGGVTVERRFDDLGRPVSETGCRRGGGVDCLAGPTNPDAPEATREFGWDRAGRRVRFSDPRNPVFMVYDDRDLLVRATTRSGSTSFRYDADGRMVSRDDEAGASEFTWTQAGELASATDALTGQRRDFDWDDAGQLEQMRSAGGALRQWFYDGMGRVRREVLRGPGGQDADFEYGYDADGSPVRQEVTLDGDAGAAANPAEGVHRYCYDDAGRLTRWDRRQPADADAPADCAPVDPAAPDAGQVTDYRWDQAGNRVAAGGEQFAYDQRNRLTAGPAGAYRYTARGTLAEVTRDEAGDGDSTASVFDALGLQAQAGTLAEVTGGGGSTVSVFDALGRQVQAGPVALAYDGLDRLVTRQSPTGLTGFAYAGAEIDPVASTGELSAAYARSPGGRLLAQAEGGGPALLAGLGRHGDLTLLHTADGALAGSAVYDPFGEPAGTAGTGSRLGFQADWTDPDSGQVWMGARWYDPAAAQFTSRDTVMGELTTPVALNRYTYASNSPLAYYDPDGRRVSAVTNGNDTPRDTAAAAAVITGRRPVPAAHREDREQLNNPQTRQREQRRRARVAMPAVSFLEEQADHYRDEGWDDDASAMGGLIDAIIDAWVRAGGVHSSLDPFAWDPWVADYAIALPRDALATTIPILVAQESGLSELIERSLTPEQREAIRAANLEAAAWLPGVGSVAEGHLAEDAWEEGDKGAAVLHAISALPLVGSFRRLGSLFRFGRHADEGIDAATAAARGVADDWAAARAAQLQSQLPAGAQGRVTMAAGVVRDGAGNQIRVVSTSEPRGYVRPGVQINEGEVVISGTGHAEADIVSWAAGHGYEVVSIGAGRPICAACATAIQNSSGSPATPLRLPR